MKRGDCKCQGSDVAKLADATIVFDLDGTLIDSAPDIIAAVNFALEKKGFRPILPEAARPMIAMGARRLLCSGVEENGADANTELIERLFAEFLRYYKAHPTDLTRTFPSVSETLERLQGLGARLVVCTTKTTDLAWLVLSSLGLASFFSGVVGADLVSAAKFHSAHVFAAIDAVSGDPASAVMIGDAEPDAHAAWAAGIPFLLVTFGYSEKPVDQLPHDLLIDQFSKVVPACIELLTARKAERKR